MESSLKELELFEDVYVPGIRSGVPMQRIGALRAMLGIPLATNPFLTLDTVPAESLWRAKVSSGQDSASALQRERIAAEQAMHMMRFRNRPEDILRCRAALMRLLLVEQLPETLCPLVKLDPRDYFTRLGLKAYAASKVAFETMLPGRFDINEIKASGIGITRHALGHLLENADLVIMGEGL